MKFHHLLFDLVIGLLIMVTMPACTSTRPARARPQVDLTSLPNFSHVFVIVLENKGKGQAVGQSTAPYLSQLAKTYARAANYHSITHPSLPNYLALTGGDTFGISSDCTDCFVDAPNLAVQLETAGKSWRAYMESMPSPCFVGDANPNYAQRHNPFIYYNNIRTQPARCQNIVPFSQFAGDLQQNSLPNFIWISPNLCHDMHDCSVNTGDQWLQQWVPKILASPAWQNNGVLFITFDENDGYTLFSGGGPVDTLVISPLVQPGFVSSVAYNHYALLHTIEAAWGLPLLGKVSSSAANPMVDFFNQADVARPSPVPESRN